MSLTRRKRELLDEMEKSKVEQFSLAKEIRNWISILLIAAAIAFVLNTFIIANSRVPSGSMENTIMTGDRLIGFRLSYLFEEPERGDIIIFRWPDDESIYFVKRIIGMPGDTVRISGGKVYLNGSDTPLEEPYLKEEMFPEADVEYTVPEGAYFVMGDNRNNSADSRRWENTFVYRDKIVAKVLFQYFPKIRLIS